MMYMLKKTLILLITACTILSLSAQKKKKKKFVDNTPKDPALAQFAIYAKTAPTPQKTTPVDTSLPLKLGKSQRVMFIGNTLFERADEYGWFESMLQAHHKDLNLEVRNFSWSADEVNLQPRPANFASLEQHLTVWKADVLFAAYGFNESFKGPDGIPVFKQNLSQYLQSLKSTAFNGKTGPQIVLVSPIANENIAGLNAADLNNKNIKLYADAMAEVAKQEKVGFANVYDATLNSLKEKSDMTYNGVHLKENGYKIFAEALFKETFKTSAPKVSQNLRDAIVDKNKQFFRRYRPLNTFYYTGGRNKKYGYLDFLPAMRSFDVMVANRDKQIWAIANGKKVELSDANVPKMPIVSQSRAANKWMTPKDELAHFDIDPRFEVNLFASEEQFADIGCPIHMKWDAKGRLWVSCSTTYPHIYPGQKHKDKLVILEDTDGDGKADKRSIFADDLHIPLAFEFGNGGVYVSEQPNLTFIKDTDGDEKADFRKIIFSGFGTEDSHHSLHDFVRTPDGDLLFRESVFHNTQVETAYGPVRAQNSAWFQYHPSTHKLTSFGNYPNTNPWGVTFDDWGFHVASHPNFASSFHATNPPYPQQHPRVSGIDAYSGTCGQEFVDFDTFPKELQGGFIKVRYKPTNRIEIHQWNEQTAHFKEKLVTNLIFSKNLSFIPVDVRFGPRGALYICDWYNPIKGHAQYSLRDERRDRKSGRIWRITAKGKKLQEPAKIAGASIEQLLENLKRKEYRIRYWTKGEIMEHDTEKVFNALNKWVANLDKNDPRFRHHQVEAMWLYRSIDKLNTELLKELLVCEIHYARAAAVRQVRYCFPHISDADDLIVAAGNDSNGLVRMEAVIAASYIGSEKSLGAIRHAIKKPVDAHLAYAIKTSLGSEALMKYWSSEKDKDIASFLKSSNKISTLEQGLKASNSNDAQFDKQPNLKHVRIECTEKMTFTVKQVKVKAGQPIKFDIVNPSATEHNLVLVTPGSTQKVGTAANEMAKSMEGYKKHFVPDMPEVLEASPLVKANKSFAMRFNAPKKPGRYPYVCTFPGHWVIMQGVLIVE